MVAVTAADPKLLRYSSTSWPNNRPANKFIGSAKFIIHIPDFFSSSWAKGSYSIRALAPQRQEEEENSSILNTTTGFNSQLLAGSIVGGAVIKYGSIVFPEITRPNILLALFMIFTPVIIATLLLIKQSRAKG